MRVAMILRPDAGRVYGGDTAVMQKMGAALRTLDAEVVVAEQAAIGSPESFDILHLMGMAPVGHVRAMLQWAQSGNVPVMCSPLYWNDFRDWYERAIVSTPRWRFLAQALGKKQAWRFYRAFQAARVTRDVSWQVNRTGMMSAAMIATTSRWENAGIADHFRLPQAVRAAMQVAPYGIDERLYGQTFTPRQLADFRSRYGLPEGYVAEVARIEEKKNQLAVIRALYADPVPLVFVGKPSPYFAPDYADCCRTLAGARGNTFFLGWLPDDELPLLYAAGSAHILPSWNELPGLASLEAGACGARVISTIVSGLPELLGAQAWYCDPYDDRSIRNAVLSALAAPAPAGLRQRLLTEFTWKKAALANLAIYEQVVRSHQ